MSALSISKVKASNKVLLYVNTNQASVNSDGDWFFTLQHPISNVRSIQLTSYSIPYDWYNIDSTCNKLYWREDGDIADRLITVAPGWYSATTLQTAISTYMNVSKGGSGTQQYTCPPTQRMDLRLEIDGGTGATKQFAFYKTSPSNNVSTISDIIGLTGTVTSSNYVLITQNILKLLPVTEVQIHLPRLISNFGTTDNDIILVHPMAGWDIGSMMRENNPSDDYASNLKEISSFVISVTDQNGWTPNFSGTQPLSFSFVVTTW